MGKHAPSPLSRSSRETSHTDDCTNKTLRTLLLALFVGAVVPMRWNYPSLGFALKRLPPHHDGLKDWPGERLCDLVQAEPAFLGTEDVSASRDRLVVVIPGNPGVPGYYSDFAHELADRLGAHVDVVGLCGHTLEPKVPPWQVFPLERQIDHIVEYIDCVGADRDVTLVGHSIGAYIALEALSRRPTRVGRVIGLMPYLENNEDCSRFVRLANFARLPPPLFWSILIVVCLALGVVRQLPLSLRRRVLAGVTPGMDESAADFTATAILQPGVFANYAFMGRTEVRNHSAPFFREGPLARGLAAAGVWRHVRLLYTEAVRAGVKAEMCDGLGHAFCTRSASTARVAEWVCRQVCDSTSAQAG